MPDFGRKSQKLLDETGIFFDSLYYTSFFTVCAPGPKVSFECGGCQFFREPRRHKKTHDTEMTKIHQEKILVGYNEVGGHPYLQSWSFESSWWSYLFSLWSVNTVPSKSLPCCILSFLILLVPLPFEHNVVGGVDGCQRFNVPVHVACKPTPFAPGRADRQWKTALPLPAKGKVSVDRTDRQTDSFGNFVDKNNLIWTFAKWHLTL